LELLVVIAIIGILSSIILVSYNGYTDKARLAKTLSWAGSINHSLGDRAVGVWTFDNITGATVNDDSGNNNNGTAYGGPAVVNGVIGKALSFDGVNDYVKSVSTVNLLGSSNDITISMWVKPGGSQKQYADLFDANHGAICNFVVQQNSTNLNLFGFGYRKGDNSGWSNAGDKTTQLATNIWQHFVIIKSGTNIDHYLNGVKNGATFTVSDDGTIYKVATYWKIGDWVAGDTGRAFNGSIDDVRIYSAALTQAQIQQYYADGLKIHQNLAVCNSMSF